MRLSSVETKGSFCFYPLPHPCQVSSLASKTDPCKINKIAHERSFVYMPGKAKVLTAKDIRVVLTVLKKPRDKTLFAVGIYTGLRIFEIIAIEQKDVFTICGGVKNILKITRLKKKNTVYSNIPIHPKLREQLETYKKFLDKQEHDNL